MYRLLFKLQTAKYFLSWKCEIMKLVNVIMIDQDQFIFLTWFQSKYLTNGVHTVNIFEIASSACSNSIPFIDSLSEFSITWQHVFLEIQKIPYNKHTIGSETKLKSYFHQPNCRPLVFPFLFLPFPCKVMRIKINIFNRNI